MRFDWRPAGYAVGSAVLMVPFAAISDWDVGDALYLCVFVLNGVGLSIAAGRKRGARMLSIAIALAVYVAASWPLLGSFYDVHTLLKWQLTKNTARPSILAQPNPANHEFKHLDWDDWGFAGMETLVYAVYDPGDSLASAADHHGPGKFAGIPCKVPRVRPLESHFYAVEFYTETSWDSCAGS